MTSLPLENQECEREATRLNFHIFTFEIKVKNDLYLLITSPTYEYFVFYA